MDLRAYVISICQRLHGATNVRFVPVSSGDWQPELGRCHENVTAWVKRHRDYIAVRGWVVWHTVHNGVRMTHHSVVQAPNGSLSDITPLLNETYREGMRFVRHVGDEKTFWEMKAAMNTFDCYDCAAP